MIASYNIYWATTKEERERIDEQSRFYYIKTEVESLNNSEEREFLKLLNSYRYLTLHPQRVKERLMMHAKSLSKEVTEDVENKRNNDLDEIKWNIDKVIKDKKYGKRLSRLLVTFLDAENPDYKYYLNSEVDETDIGKITKKTGSRGHKKTRVMFNYYLEDMKASLQKKIYAIVLPKSLNPAINFDYNYQAAFSGK